MSHTPKRKDKPVELRSALECTLEFGHGCGQGQNSPDDAPRPFRSRYGGSRSKAYFRSVRRRS